MPEQFSEWGLVVGHLVTAAIFDPLKRRIQGWVDRAFDRHRYDYRKALVEFGRGLSSETDLDALLAVDCGAVAAPLLVARVAVFLADDAGRCDWPPRTDCRRRGHRRGAQSTGWRWASSTSIMQGPLAHLPSRMRSRRCT
jgi:hypothetical protein